MKKKIFSLLLAVCMAIPMAFSLVACDKSETDEGTEATKQSTMSSNNITLSYAETVYDGTEKEPAVTLKYDDKIVTSDNYTVEYSNNVNAGTATVVVKSNADSEVLDANLTFTTTFEIQRAPIMVKTSAQLNAAILLTDANHVVKLANNINDKDASNKVIPIVIFPTENMDVAIDLNGYDINSHISVRSKVDGVNTPANVVANVNIFNSSNEESVVGSSTSEVDYAFKVFSNNKFNINLNNVKFQGYWGGIATNGSYCGETVINAKDCKFVALKETAASGTDASVGAYFAAGQYIYNFEDCEFVGFGGYYTKAGHHFLKDCTVIANGTIAFPKAYNNNGGDITGSAIMIDSCASYVYSPAAGYQRQLTVDISGGRFISASNYALQEFSTYEKVADKKCYSFIHVTDDAIFESHISLDTNISIENSCAYYSHEYSNDEDITCNECGAKRETLTCNVWDGKTAALPEINDGVMLITNAEQLAALAVAVNEGNTFEDVTVRLMIDLDLDNLEWTPIGYGGGKNYKAFSGIFDGGNHTIYNLKVTKFIGGTTYANASSGVGLFGQIRYATIKNVRINGAEVRANHYVGALVGYAYDESNIENCIVSNAKVYCTYANTDDSGDKAGAIVGFIMNSTSNSKHQVSFVSNVLNCSANKCEIYADRDAGYIVGCASTKIVVSGCTASESEIIANENAVGTNMSGDIIGKNLIKV